MTVLAFALGAALLGLAGYFIASCAVAGLAVASTFSFLFPSAGVQALAWARTLGRYGERIATHQVTLDLVGTLRTSLFARALRLPRARVAELRSSELLGRLTVDSDAVENLLLRGWFPILAAIAALIATVALFAWLSATLAIVAVAGLLLTGAVLIGLAHHQAGRPAQTVVAARADARHTLIEALNGLPELRSFGAEERAAADVARQLDGLARSRGRLAVVAARGQSFGTLLADVTLLAVVATAAGLVGTGTLSAPAFVAVCLIAIAVIEPVVALPVAVTALARARAASARLAELFPDAATPEEATRVLDTPPWPIEIELWRALAAAALDDTVAAFPAGLDTPVGPGGAALSGGQRRRLSVAQGLLRDPDVLLDEPTEGLDTATAARLLAGVRAFDPSAALVIALIAIVMGCLFIVSYSLALGDPVPRGIDAALGGNPAAHPRVVDAAEEVARGKLDVSRYASVTSALHAIDEQRVYAALDLEGTRPTLQRPQRPPSPARSPATAKSDRSQRHDRVGMAPFRAARRDVWG